MQYVAAYTLAALSGKEPTKDAVNNILKATGGKFDEAEVNKLFTSVGGKPVHELIARGESKVGAVGGSAPAATVTKAAPAAQPKAAEKKPAPVQEEAAEDEDFNLDLFG